MIMQPRNLMSWQKPISAGRSSLAVLGFLAFGFLLCQTPTDLYGQAQITASITGTALDRSGAAVPGAAVTLSDPTRALIRNFTTQADGRYVFTLVPPGTYTL